MKNVTWIHYVKSDFHNHKENFSIPKSQTKIWCLLWQPMYINKKKVILNIFWYLFKKSQNREKCERICCSISCESEYILQSSVEQWTLKIERPSNAINACAKSTKKNINHRACVRSASASDKSLFLAFLERFSYQGTLGLTDIVT